MNSAVGSAVKLTSFCVAYDSIDSVQQVDSSAISEDDKYQSSSRSLIEVKNVDRLESYTFDKCFTYHLPQSDDVRVDSSNSLAMSSRNLEHKPAKEMSDMSLNVALLGFNSSIIFMDTVLQSQIRHFDVVDNLCYIAEKLVKSIESCANWTLNCECFEIFDNKIRDLATSADSPGTFKIREDIGKGTILVDGLSSFSVDSLNGFMLRLKDVIKRRLVLVVGDAASPGTLATSNPLAPGLAMGLIDEVNDRYSTLPQKIGFVGHLFANFYVSQNIRMDLQAADIFRSSLMQTVHLAPAEVLTHHRPTATSTTSASSSSVGSCIMTLSDFDIKSNKYFVSGGNQLLSNDVTDSSTASYRISSLQSSLKSLSTLTRVVRALKLNTADQGQNHVPFRDHLLTRMLKPSLSGNCCMFFLLVTSLQNANASKALRFGCEIGGLYNSIRSIESIKRYKLDNLKSADVVATEKYSASLTTHNRVDLHPLEIATVSEGSDHTIPVKDTSLNSVDHSEKFRQVMSSMADDLRGINDDLSLAGDLDRTRWTSLQELGLKLRPFDNNINGTCRSPPISLFNDDHLSLDDDGDNNVSLYPHSSKVQLFSNAIHEDGTNQLTNDRNTVKVQTCLSDTGISSISANGFMNSTIARGDHDSSKLFLPPITGDESLNSRRPNSASKIKLSSSNGAVGVHPRLPSQPSTSHHTSGARNSNNNNNNNNNNMTARSKGDVDLPTASSSTRFKRQETSLVSAKSDAAPLAAMKGRRELSDLKTAQMPRSGQTESIKKTKMARSDDSAQAPKERSSSSAAESIPPGLAVKINQGMRTMSLLAVEKPIKAAGKNKNTLVKSPDSSRDLPSVGALGVLDINKQAAAAAAADDDDDDDDGVHTPLTPLTLSPGIKSRQEIAYLSGELKTHDAMEISMSIADTITADEGNGGVYDRLESSYDVRSGVEDKEHLRLRAELPSLVDKSPLAEQGMGKELTRKVQDIDRSTSGSLPNLKKVPTIVSSPRSLRIESPVQSPQGDVSPACRPGFLQDSKTAPGVPSRETTNKLHAAIESTMASREVDRGHAIETTPAVAVSRLQQIQKTPEVSTAAAVAASTGSLYGNSGKPVEMRMRLGKAMLPQEDNDADGDGLDELERKFLRSVSTSNFREMERCIGYSVNIHVKNSFGRDAMQIASRNGDLAILKHIHQNGGNISSRGPRGDSLFHLACSFGQLETMRWLHGQGVFPECLDMIGQSVVHVAARRAEFEVLKYLYFELYMDFTLEDFEGQTPYECIPRRGDELLLAKCRKFVSSVLERRDVSILEWA